MSSTSAVTKPHSAGNDPPGGSGYHEGALFTHALPSATAMRNLLFSNPHKDLELSALASCMPEAVFHAFQNAVASHGLLTADDFSLLLAARLLTETKGSLSSCLDLSPDLANRILRQRHACSSFSEFAMQLKTKEMTYTRISRALMHLLLNQKTLYPAGYNRVLGFRKSAGALLKEIRRRSSLPLIAKQPTPRGFLPAMHLPPLRAIYRPLFFTRLSVLTKQGHRSSMNTQKSCFCYRTSFFSSSSIICCCGTV